MCQPGPKASLEALIPCKAPQICRTQTPHRALQDGRVGEKVSVEVWRVVVESGHETRPCVAL